jgi:hypothetical protein
MTNASGAHTVMIAMNYGATTLYIMTGVEHGEMDEGEHGHRVAANVDHRLYFLG